VRPWKELQLKFRALEEHLEDELLKTGKALRKDFREESGSWSARGGKRGYLPGSWLANPQEVMGKSWKINKWKGIPQKQLF